MSLCVRVGDDIGGLWVSNGYAARVGVLNDGNRWLVEIKSCPKSRIGVYVVVVRHLFATKLASLSNARNGGVTGGAVNRGSLVRVFAVAKHVAQLCGNFETGGKTRVLTFTLASLTRGFLPVGL